MISLYQTILVYLENSDNDKNTIENVCTFSKATHPKKIIFLNVVKDFNLPESVIKQFPELINNALIDREKSIKNIVTDCFDCDVPYETLVHTGNDVKEILKITTRLKVDLIIFGKKKDSESIFATRIARRSPCNILIIPEGSNIDLSKVLVPVDFSEYSVLSLRQAHHLTSGNNSKIYIQNVYQIPSSYRYSGKSFSEFGELMKENAANDLKVILKNVKFNETEIEQLYSLDKGIGLLNTIYKVGQQINVGLVVMGAKGKTAASAFFIGSKVERMIRINRSIPLLILRKKGDIQGLIESYIST